jgi:outer membrane protein assembly factor BamD
MRPGKAAATALVSPVARLASMALVASLGLAMVVFACGCEGEGAKSALGYTDSAKRAYDKAMEEFQTHSWLQAQNMFRDVKRKYSYSKYARLAELRIADADYEQEKFSEAIHEYKDFIHAHRAEEEDVAYARSRIAEATYAEIPESFLSPAEEERDQASVGDAYKEMKSYLADYPASKDAAKIRGLLTQIIGRLVKHELYVARFYLRKDNDEAAVARIEYALHNYGGLLKNPGDGPEGADLVAEALVLLGQTYLRMHKWSDARQAFQAVVRGYERSPFAVQARNYLDMLRNQGV